MRAVGSLAMVGLLGGAARAMKEEDRVDGRALPGWKCTCCSDEHVFSSSFAGALISFAVIFCAVLGRCSRW
eukprot:COSAG02_NODE_2559_length_8529_cov_5.446382_3_plen_71_part_00